MPSKVCFGQVLTVSGEPSDIKNIGYNFSYDGKTPAVNVSTRSTNTWTYTAPGSYTILQKGNRANGTIACRTVEVVNPQKISFTPKVCSGLSTTVTYNLTAETAGYDRITISWGDGANEVINGPFTAGAKQATHTYANTLARTIVLRGEILGASGCQGPTSDPVTIVPVGSSAGGNPIINSLTSTDNSITLRYQLPSGNTAEIQRKEAGAGGYTSIGTVSQANTFSIAAPSDKVTCFQVVTRDACGTEQRSAEVCSLVLNAQAADRQNILNWIPYSGAVVSFRQYRIYRNGAPAGGVPSLGAGSYTDGNNIQCGDRYCYRLEANVDQTVITSAETCVTGIGSSTFAGPASAFVSVQGDGVYVKSALPQPQPTPAAVYTLVVARANGVGGPFSDLGTSSDLTYTDRTASTGSQQYCYQTALINKCGSKSPYTKPACTVLLTANSDGSLRWTNESPFSEEAPGSYLIVRINPGTGNPDDKFDVGKVSEYRPDPTSPVTQYQVVAVDSKGIESYSNPVDIQLAPKIFVPNAFSPNGDGANNEFMPKGLFWNQFEMTIFDRWGGVVYNTTDKDARGWNGDANGQPAQAGYYTYRIRITDTKGQPYERTGRFLLIR